MLHRMGGKPQDESGCYFHRLANSCQMSLQHSIYAFCEAKASGFLHTVSALATEMIKSFLLLPWQNLKHQAGLPVYRAARKQQDRCGIA